MTSPETVAALLEQMEATRADFELAVQEANERGPAPAGRWSAIDHVAHIAAWEHSLLQLLRGEPRHADLEVDPRDYAGMGEDEINELIYEKYHNVPAKEIRRYYEETHRELIDALQGLDDEGLRRPYSHYQPDDPPYNPQPVIGWITGNTTEHYREHAEILRRT